MIFGIGYRVDNRRNRLLRSIYYVCYYYVLFYILKFRSITTHIDDFPGSERGGVGGTRPPPLPAPTREATSFMT